MLKDEDRIFKNLYNDLGWDIESAIKEEIILFMRLKILNYVEEVEQDFQPVLNYLSHLKKLVPGHII